MGHIYCVVVQQCGLPLSVLSLRCLVSLCVCCLSRFGLSAVLCLVVCLVSLIGPSEQRLSSENVPSCALVSRTGGCRTGTSTATGFATATLLPLALLLLAALLLALLLLGALFGSQIFDFTLWWVRTRKLLYTRIPLFGGPHT